MTGTVKQLIMPANRAFDSNGFPSVGATASLYLSGTMTPALFYSDSGLTTSIGSTITANDAGRFYPMPYQDSTVAFRLIVQDDTGATLEDIDPFYFGYQTGATGPTGSQGPAGDVAKALTRSALAAITGATAGMVRYLSEAGREGAFVFDSANHSINVTNDPNQALYIAPSSDTTGASGAWVRKFDRDANVKWWGAQGDGTTNDNAAITAALATLSSLKLSGGSVIQYGPGASIPLYFPSGNYYCGSSPITVTTYAAHICGAGSGEPGGAGTQFTFANNTSGFQFFGTTSACAGWILEHCSIVGGYTNGTEGEYHGIQWYWPGTFRDCQIYNFPGDGIVQNNEYGYTTTNSNGFEVSRILIQGCRNGVYNWGADSNAGIFSGIGVTNCRQSGFFVGQGLGNVYTGCWAELNGNTSWNTGAAGQPCSLVYYNGHVYTVVLGQQTWCSTNAPSGTATSNQGWIYCWDAGGASTGIPAWTSGINVRPGGEFLQHGLADQTSFVGCYAEADAWNQVDEKCVIIGPQGGLGNYTSLVSGYAVDKNRVQTVAGTLNQAGGIPVISSEGGIHVHSQLTVDYPIFAGAGYSYFGPQSGAAADNNFYLDNTNYHSFLWARTWTAGSPTTIGYIDFNKAGQTAYNNNISGGNHSFQIAGTEVASITSSGINLAGSVLSSSSSGGMGYSTGAGGTVTQTTSRTTGVTINKVCGSITLVSAAGSSTYSTFTVTNSTVSATDTVDVVQKSGSNIYSCLVTAVAAGSFNVSVAAVSGTATEAPVLNFTITKGVTA